MARYRSTAAWLPPPGPWKRRGSRAAAERGVSGRLELAAPQPVAPPRSARCRCPRGPQPTIIGPHHVIVRVAGAGLRRTEVHIRDGWFAFAVPADLPLTLGHEN